MSIIQGTSKSSAAEYTIDQSIRFNNDDSAYLSRTPSSDGNLTTWTYSVWFKRSAIAGGTAYTLMSAGADNTNDSLFYFGPANEEGTLDIFFRESSSTQGRITSYSSSKSGGRYFRDPAAWMHFVLVWDTTNSTSADRIRLYINGERATTDAFAITEPSLNDASRWNTARANYISKARDNSTNYFDGYMADINFIDGQALTAASFGETNSDTGQWVPKRYTGSYGTNGFYLKGEDSSNLGNDSSGNNNDFTSSGLAAADQRDDSPTLNKSTLNPLDTGANQTLSDGNLTVTNGSATGSFWNRSTATQGLTYKTYYEIHADNLGSLNMGLTPTGLNVHDSVNNPAGNVGCGIQNNEIFVTGSYASESSGSITFPIATGNYVMFAYDPDRNALWVGVEGTWKDGTGSSASSSTILSEIEGSGTSYAIFTGIGSNPVPYIGQYSTSVATARFSSQEWEGTAPTGYEQLAPSVLPDPTIADPSAYFQTTLYTGDGVGSGSGGQEINQTGNSTFQPDFVWNRVRNLGTETHCLQDVVRGANKRLQSNSSAAENTETEGLLSFDSDGFTVGSRDPYNKNTATYVAWQWLADNTSGSSNTDGATTSTVSANTTSGFSIVKWTGTGANTTLGHGLGATPKVLIVKNLADADSWVVYHEDVGATKGLTLDGTAAETTASTFFNNTAPTSSVFSVGSGGRTNGSSDGMIAYCFAEIEGFSKFGSYTGNGSTDGPFIYTGFMPEFIMVKSSSSSGTNWDMLDATRETFNTRGNQLFANSNAAEASNDHECAFLSNGFKWRDTSSSVNTSGTTYIFMAFAESPFKTATAR